MFRNPRNVLSSVYNVFTYFRESKTCIPKNINFSLKRSNFFYMFFAHKIDRYLTKFMKLAEKLWKYKQNTVVEFKR